MADEPSEFYGVFLARKYVNEAASQVQWDSLANWLKNNKIDDGVSAWRLDDGDGWVIAVFDLTGRCSEFSWAGDPFQLSDRDMESLVQRVDAVLEHGGVVVRLRYPPGSRPQRGPDGRWAIPVNRG